MLFKKEIFRFLAGTNVSGLTQDLLVVFLDSLSRLSFVGNCLVLSSSDSLNRTIYKQLLFFESELVYYPERVSVEPVPGFDSQYNRHRSNAIIQIAGKRPVCCLTTRKASETNDINNKTVLSSTTINIGEKIDRDVFINKLLSFGYYKVESVYSRGEFSTRGDIVDIFPDHVSLPVRISANFGSVDAMSYFDVDTQRRTKNIDSFCFWDLAGKTKTTGRNLVDFILWDFVVCVEKHNNAFQVVSDKGKNTTTIKSERVKDKINSKKKLNRFLKKNLKANHYIFFPNTKTPEFDQIRNLKVVPGFINQAVLVKTLGAVFIPHWLRKTKPRSEKTHKGLLNNNLYNISKGDFVVHVLHGVGKFSGLKTRGPYGYEKEYLKIIYKNNGVLFVPIDSLGLVHRYLGVGKKPNLNRLGRGGWQTSVSKTKKEIELVSDSLVEIYKSRKLNRGFIYKKTKDIEVAIKKSFPFKETRDQKKTIKRVLKDLKKETPMDRLICGDVGFGKTEVALRAIVRVASSSKQSLFLCPTTILSDQHYISAKERLEPLGIRVSLISRFQTKKEQSRVLNNILHKKTDLIIGTHRLLSDDVVVPALGLLIVDEEHRFGVKHKENIRSFRPSVDVLSMSATPIPRTLQQSVLGIRDISRINTPPITRKPIQTFVEFFSWNRAAEIIRAETRRGGQVYFLHNNIQSINYYTKKLRDLLPEETIENIHGQKRSKKMEKTLFGFFNGFISVLVCSTIIESGLDVTNANCIIVNNPQNLGLSQLYQIRGRVGRGSRQAFCYLFVPKRLKLSQGAYRRLKTIERHTSLGSGFSIASNDLDIRGAGLIFGYKQSGQISRVGLEHYNALLKEAVNKKLNKLDSKPQVNISFFGKALIPVYYVSDNTARIYFYTKTNNAEKKEELVDIKNELIDRYGKIPKETSSFMNLAFLRLLYKNTNLKNIAVDVASVSFELREKDIGGNTVKNVLAYKNNLVKNKKFKENPFSLLVIFSLAAGYDWYKLLIDCNSLFYKP